MAAKQNTISTSDVDLQDPLFNDLNLGEETPDLAIVTEDSMKSERLKQYTSELAFMEDMLTFTIGMSELPNAPDPIECAVNGEKRIYYRGRQYKDKRKFINAMINVSWNIDVVNRKDPVTGLDMSTIKRTPFNPISINIQSDPAGDVGSKWLAYKLNGDTVVK